MSTPFRAFVTSHKMCYHMYVMCIYDKYRFENLYWIRRCTCVCVHIFDTSTPRSKSVTLAWCFMVTIMHRRHLYIPVHQYSCKYKRDNVHQYVEVILRCKSIWMHFFFSKYTYVYIYACKGVSNMCTLIPITYINICMKCKEIYICKQTLIDTDIKNEVYECEYNNLYGCNCRTANSYIYIHIYIHIRMYVYIYKYWIIRRKIKYTVTYICKYNETTLFKYIQINKIYRYIYFEV